MNKIKIRNRLIEVMKEKGLNTKDLSEIAGLNKCTISHLRGKSTLNTTSIETLIKLADALNVKPDDLYEIIEE